MLLPPYAVPMRSSFSAGSAPCRLRPHTLHATRKSPPRRAAPPTPTQTPITVFLVEDDIPEDFFSSPLPEREGVPEADDELDVELAVPEALDPLLVAVIIVVWVEV